MPSGDKLDLHKVYRKYYTATPEPTLITVDPTPYLTISGRGEPGGEAYTEKLNALYSVAYTVKFALKAQGQDFKVAALEGLWWVDDPTRDFFTIPRQEWNWKQLTRMPEFITPEIVEQCKAQAKAKKKLDEIDNVHLEIYDEGQCAQILHVGPYATEGESIRKMVEFMQAHGLEAHGLHHEVYLTDPRRVAPEKNRTIIRQPVRTVKG